MYKNQMTFQKVVCVLVLVASALVFVYSLGISTDLYDAFSKAVMYPDDPEYTFSYVTGATIYYEMFDFNTLFTKVGIGLIVVTLVLFITNTHSRRKYYIGNYIAVGLSTAANIGITVWCIPQILNYKARYQNEVNFEELKAFSKDWGTLYIGPEDTFWFDASFIVFGILLFTSCLLIVNLIWKIIMMNAEQNAIGRKKDVVDFYAV